MSDGYYYRGLSKTKLKQYKTAVIDFEEAKNKERLQMEENANLLPNAGISDGLGRCFHAIGNYERAIDDFLLAIENAGNAFEKKEFLLHKAHCEFDNGFFDKSIEDLQKGLETYQSDPELLYYLGLSYYATNENYKEALNTFKMSLTNMPKEDAGVQFSLSYTPDIYYHIGLAYCRVEKFEKSIYPFTKVSN